MREQTEPAPTVAEQLAGPAEDAVPVDPPLSFPECANLTKQLAMRGKTRVSDALDFVATVIGSRPAALKLLTRSQGEKVLAALPPLRKE